MSQQKTLTPEQVRARLRARGETLTQWAAEHGYDRRAVYRVMSGADKAWFGRAHEIAVALGLKVRNAESNVPCSTGNTHTRAAA